MSKKNKIIVVIIVLAIIILTVGVVVLIYQCDKNYSSKKEEPERVIDFTMNCFTLTYSGPNQNSYVEAKLNDSEVKDVFKEKLNPKYVTGMEWLYLVAEICSNIEINIDKSEGLSNGDVIRVSFVVPQKYLEEYNLVLGESEFEVIVSGRPDKSEYDPFDGIIFVVNNDDNKSIGMINSNDLLSGYEIDYAYDFIGADNKQLSIDEIQLNDVITICLDEKVADELSEKGYVATVMSKTITVEENNIQKVTDISDLTDEFILMLKNDANDVIFDVYSKYSNITIKDIMFVDGWFTDTYSIGENKFVMVYQINFAYVDSNNRIKDGTIYLALSTNMIYKDNNGGLIILGIQNEPYSATTLIDSSIMLQIQGEKLEDINDRYQDYTKID